MDVMEIREGGIGNGFKVIDPADGFRQDNRLWFGTCSECGETVTNSYLSGGIWEHTVYTLKKYYVGSTHPNHSRSHKVGYCPKVEGKVVECEIIYETLEG